MIGYIHPLTSSDCTLSKAKPQETSVVSSAKAKVNSQAKNCSWSKHKHGPQIVYCNQYFYNTNENVNLHQYTRIY